MSTTRESVRVSIKLMALAWEVKLRPARKLVLMCLCDFSDDHGHSWPSQATIAHKCDLSVRQVRDHLHALGELVDVSDRYRDSGARTSNSYQINVQKLAARAVNLAPDPPAGTMDPPAKTAGPPGEKPQGPPEADRRGILEPPLKPPSDRSAASKQAINDRLLEAGWQLHQITNDADVVQLVIEWIRHGLTLEQLDRAIAASIEFRGSRSSTPIYLRGFVRDQLSDEKRSRPSDRRANYHDTVAEGLGEGGSE